jgi:cellulose synthase/poly-beta-1,6-N-acetylglucosamine synthase-like glycosyltransferase
MLITILTAILLFLYACLILFYYIQWRKVPLVPAAVTAPNAPKVTVIIAARNEERDLPVLLEDLARQDYPEELFEVIIVNDYSTDGTAKVIDNYSKTNFLMVNPECPPEDSTKKKAIATGVQLAKGELLIITDADCRVNPGWISTISGYYTSRKAYFIAAPVKFEHNNSLLEVLQCLDFMTLQGVTAASVASGFTNMANGANLAYTKTAFTSVNGFEGIDHVATGDDMLLMHKIWKLDNTKVCYLKSKEAIVRTQPMHTWKDFLMQRRRWASKTFVYDDYKIIIVLALVYLVNLLFIVIFVAAILDSGYWSLFIVYLLVKSVIELPFIVSVAKFYEEEKLLKYFFPLQPLHIVYTVIIGAISQFGKYEWKGRQTR